jgi:hypothetical protein
MKAVGSYDSALQMFVEEPRNVDLKRVTFIRWLVENNRLEHPVSGPASGELVVVAAQAESDGRAGLPEAVSAFPRMPDGATRVNLDLGRRFDDGVQIGSHHPEGRLPGFKR